VDNLKKLDGGNLEDALIALGEFGEHNMEGLLDFVSTGRLSETILQNAMIMLTLSLSDNPRAQLNVLQARRRLLANIEQTQLSRQREIAIKAIDKAVEQIQPHM
jgi:hypothetical protein